MSENRDEGASQLPEANTDTQSIGHQAETHSTPGALPGSRVHRVRGIIAELLEKLMKLKHIVEDHFEWLTDRQMLGLQSEEQFTRVIREHKDRIGSMVCHLANFMWSEAIGSLGVKEPLLPPHSRGDVTGAQPDQPGPRWNDLEVEFISHALPQRGVSVFDFYYSNIQIYEAYQKDRYHEDRNPLGFLNLGTSENKLCLDLLTDRLYQRDMNYVEDVLLQSSHWRGYQFLREEVARFLTYYCKACVPLDPENVVVLNGCDSVFSALTTVLCNPGEAFLIPTPCYGGFIFSSHMYAKVELIPVNLGSEITSTNTHPFQLSVDKLEVTLLDARNKAKIVRGLVLTNPQNPLGDVYSQDALKEYLEFAKRNNLHVIIDETYMLSVFNKYVEFHSVLSIESLPDPNRTHVIWGTSKDFGISGFCFGALYTHNKEVATAMTSFGFLHGISGITQYKLYRLLRDRDWIDRVYLPTHHSRLRKAHRFITEKLRALEIPFLYRGAGIYVWINLKAYLEPCTFAEELILYRRFLAHKLILSHGNSYLCVEPGWFRLIFAENHLQLQVAMRRFRDALAEQRQHQVENMLEDALRE